MIDQPHLVIYGTCVAKEFWASLTAGSLEDGLVGRMMVFESWMLDEVEELSSLPPLNESMLAEVASWVEFEPPSTVPASRRIGTPPAVMVQHTPEAWERQWQHIKKIVKGRLGESDSVRGVWRRSGEKTGKLAMLSACSRNPPISGRPVVIELVDVNWAIKLCNWLTRRLLTQAGLYVSENVHHDNLNRILRLLSDWKSKEEIGQNVRWLRAKERNEILEWAVNDEMVTRRPVACGNKTKYEYIRSDRLE